MNFFPFVLLANDTRIHCFEILMCTWILHIILYCTVIQLIILLHKYNMKLRRIVT